MSCSFVKSGFGVPPTGMTQSGLTSRNTSLPPREQARTNSPAVRSATTGSVKFTGDSALVSPGFSFISASAAGHQLAADRQLPLHVDRVVEARVIEDFEGARYLFVAGEGPVPLAAEDADRLE